MLYGLYPVWSFLFVLGSSQVSNHSAVRALWWFFRNVSYSYLAIFILPLSCMKIINSLVIATSDAVQDATTLVKSS